MNGDVPETPSLDVLLDFEKALLWEAKLLVEKAGVDGLRSKKLSICLDFGSTMLRGSATWRSRALPGGIWCKAAAASLDSLGALFYFEEKHERSLDPVSFEASCVPRSLLERAADASAEFGIASLSEAAASVVGRREAVLQKLWSAAAAGSLRLTSVALASKLGRDGWFSLKFRDPTETLLDWAARGEDTEKLVHFSENL